MTTSDADGAPEARPPSGVDLIAAERLRQVEVEGWTAQHDHDHPGDDLARAAACYALPDGWRDIRGGSRRDMPYLWPWASGEWKPTPGDRRRELVKAGALIAAEIDRLTWSADDD